MLMSGTPHIFLMKYLACTTIQDSISFHLDPLWTDDKKSHLIHNCVLPSIILENVVSTLAKCIFNICKMYFQHWQSVFSKLSGDILFQLFPCLALAPCLRSSSHTSSLTRRRRRGRRGLWRGRRRRELASTLVGWTSSSLGMKAQIVPHLLWWSPGLGYESSRSWIMKSIFDIHLIMYRLLL